MALGQDRNTPARAGDTKSLGAAASKKFFGGAIVMRNAAGYATPGATATGLAGVGRCEKQIDNSSGSNGDLAVTVRPGIFQFANSTSTDEITAAEIGKPCYAVDDQTVAKTDGSAARSIAGFIFDVDAQGVWVEFDEAKVQAYIAGVTLPEA
jgi:hypothetical protein